MPLIQQVKNVPIKMWGQDGYGDNDEAPTDAGDPLLNSIYQPFSGLDDPANDNYTYFLNTEGNIFERYKKYNGVEGNTPETFSRYR